MTTDPKRGGTQKDEDQEMLEKLLREVVKIREHLKHVSWYVDVLGNRIENMLNDPDSFERRT